ncbi:M10 family metallopeptidase C-terminal domain-containing protein [Rhodobacter sp. NSM]|uniref:M10 family metallopeptidase C-terminal domain-containing protein n=1 Tax=Rhodobacter sp. NSM TaxID=3457501 RepID=UPI003FCF00B6
MSLPTLIADRDVEDAIAERAALSEGRDAPASTGTSYRMSVGDSFTGTLSSAGDRDFVGIQLVAGQTYTIDLAGSGANPVYDTYLRLYSSNGTLLQSNDDGGEGFNSRLTFTASSSGTYYISAGSFSDSYTGSYRITTSRAPDEVWTQRQIADQLVSGYWESTGQRARGFDVGQGDTLNVDISGLTSAGQHLATVALQTWTAVTGIRFDTTPSAGATVHITIDDNGTGAYSSSVTSGGEILSSTVNVSRDWLSSYGTGLNTYSLQTYIHELGHALGLGHAGNYNGTATYGVSNLYANDSWQATVMSYFSQTENSYIQADEAYVMTPMIADILAMQTIYGTSRGIRSGNTVYGDDSNAGGMYARIEDLAGREVAWTIFDQGGRDMLDVSSSSAAQLIDLRPGAISNVYGAVGNLSIARGTIIEAARGGSGNDRMIGNSANNTLNGGGGADTMRGGTGNDAYITNGGDTIIERAGEGIDHVISSASCRLANNVENLTLSGSRAIDGVGNGLGNRITGNSAANDLTGGAGHDTFVFEHALGNGNVDRITDFAVVDDTIRLEDAIFRGLSRGWLDASAFTSNGSGRATDASDRIIYETDSGALWYDRDGAGGASAVRFATLDAGLNVTAADFLVL